MSLIFYFLTFISIPTYWIYASGAMKESPMGTPPLSYITLGNIGQSQEQCNYMNLQTFNHSMLKCPPGSKISEILEIGLEDLSSGNNNACPPYNYDTISGIKLDLDPTCTWKWKRRHSRNNHAVEN